MNFFKQIYGIQVPVLDDEKFSMRVLVSENLYHFRAKSGNLCAKQETCGEELKIIHFWIGCKKKKIKKINKKVSSGTENFGFRE